ncbi:MAG: MlaD family protein [Lentisphaeria bacterium]
MNARRRLTLKDFSTEFAVGAFFITALVLLAVFTIVVSSENIFSPQWERTVKFPSVGGLNVGSDVLAKGVKIGSVKDIELRKDDVLLTLKLNEDLTIYEDYSVRVRYSSLLGGKYVAIDSGNVGKDKIPEDEVLQGDAPTDILDSTTDVINDFKEQLAAMQKQLDESDFIPNLTSMVDNLQVVSDQLKSGQGTLGRLLMEEDMHASATEAIAEFKETSGRLSETAQNVDGAVADLRAGKGTLGKLLTDDEAYKNFNSITRDLKDGKGTLGKLIVDDEFYNTGMTISDRLATLTDDLAAGKSSLGKVMQDDGELYDEILATAGNTQDISRRLKEGEGTLGKILQDEELYNEILAAVKEAKEAVEDYREQAPISTFSNFIFGAF